ncbi:MAG: 3-deoxy-8-phosphooctulonate synthase [Phycisphaerae bacterium]|jgi:2-dehydro-3-deoxyphosphooctonate aldolase (KDO 8-P synthase)
MTEQNKTCRIGPVSFGEGKLALIAGPCVAESLELCMEVATTVADICRRLDIGFVFKASYDKANRSSAAGFRGPGLAKGLDWLAQVRQSVGVPVLSDIHESAQAQPAAAVLDCLQIPAFLCRQTDLLAAAGRTHKPVNIKKGQFMAPWDMKGAVEKVTGEGNNKVLLTERGNSFGYNRLVTDFCGLADMRAYAPVVFDVTHSVQEPGALGNASGGRRHHAPILAAAAMAAGADALFIETHPDPARAKSDAAVMVPLNEIEKLLCRCLALFKVAR